MLLTSAIFQFLPLNFQSSNEAYFRKVWEKPLFQNVSSKICCKKFFSNVAFYNLIFHEVLLQKKSKDLFLLKFVRCNLTNFLWRAENTVFLFCKTYLAHHLKNHWVHLVFQPLSRAFVKVSLLCLLNESFLPTLLTKEKWTSSK